MSRFNPSDIQSSTLLYATDSLDELLDVVRPMIQTNGPDALVGLTLSVHMTDSGEVVEADDEAIMSLLQSRKAYASVTASK